MQQSFLLRMAWESFLVRSFRNLCSDEGNYVLDEEWDNLIILDACRYDYFKALNDVIEGSLQKRVSVASETVEWINKNFCGEDCSDTIYVTANPRSKETYECLDNFYKVVDSSDRHWNEDMRTVLPKGVIEDTKIAKMKYPDKKFIVHFMQPHHPFVTNPELYEIDKGLEWEHEDYEPEGIYEKFIGNHMAKVFPPLEVYLQKRNRAFRNIWTRVQDGEIDPEDIKLAYGNNLMYVLKEIKSFVNSLEGKTVISADHGNVFGEYFIYKHPPAVRVRELVEVPWFIVGDDNG